LIVRHIIRILMAGRAVLISLSRAAKQIPPSGDNGGIVWLFRTI